MEQTFTRRAAFIAFLVMGLAASAQEPSDRNAEAQRQARQQYLEEQQRIVREAAAMPPDKANVRYGPHERNVLDLWLPKGKHEGPRPLVVYIHGGGWLGGDKVQFYADQFKRFLDAGLVVASINYRFSNIEPYPTPIRDGGLAVQFLRHHASEYNIDSTRVAAYGVSAGAVTSMWLGFRDDLADPDASDPVLRQSTRLTCVGSIAGPTTLDKQTMDEWFGMKVVAHRALLPFYGITTVQELYSEKVRQVAAEASPINLLSKGDPPVFLDFPQDYKPLPEKHDQSVMIHHPLFGVKLKEAADKLGVEAVFQAKNKRQDRYKDLVDFIIQKLTTNPSPSADASGR